MFCFFRLYAILAENPATGGASMGQKKRSPDQGLKLLLIRDYLYKEASAEHPRNSKDIQAFLAEHEIKASTRTIQEDVRRLRDILNIPIAYNPKKWGYYISQKQFEQGELELLINCIRCSTFMTEQDSAQLIQKVKALGNAHDRKMIEQRMAEEGKKQQTGNSIIQNLQLITEAIEKRCKISYQWIQYVAEHSTHTELNPEIEFASPHELIWSDGRYELKCAIDCVYTEADFEEDMCIEEWREEFPELVKNGTFEDFYQKECERCRASIGTVTQLYTSIDISRLANLTITKLPSTYQKKEQKPATDAPIIENQPTEQVITLRFRREMLKQVAMELGKDAILISDDERYFTTSIRRVPDHEFFQWLYPFDCYAKILRPQEVIDKYLHWCRYHLVDLEILYERNLEPYYALTQDEFFELPEEDDKILYAATMGRWKCHHELLLPDDGGLATPSPEMLEYVQYPEDIES